MSNDLQITTGELPSYLQKMQYVDSGLSAGVAPKAPKLGVTQAKEFTITRDGQKMILPTKTVRVVLIASASNITKAWYEKSFQPGSSEAPDCFSDDGKVPAEGALKKQCNSCAVCPKNAFGSHPTTGRGKACADRKRVVLVWEGEPDTLMTFMVPTMSMGNLRRIDEELKKANIPPQAVLMELKFDPAYTYPVVQLGAVGFVDEATAKKFLALKDTDEVLQLLRETESGESAPAPLAEAPVVPTQIVQFGGATAQPEPEVEAEAEKPKRGRKPKVVEEAPPKQEAPAAEEEEEDDEEEDAPAAPAASSNVLDLISRWKA